MIDSMSEKPNSSAPGPLAQITSSSAGVRIAMRVAGGKALPHRIERRDVDVGVLA